MKYIKNRNKFIKENFFLVDFKATTEPVNNDSELDPNTNQADSFNNTDSEQVQQFSNPIINNFKQDYAIVKCMTSNGEKLGIEKMGETDCDVIHANLTYADAVAKIDDCSRNNKLPIYDNENDTYLGKVSKAYIRKTPVDGSTSYKQ